MSGPKSSRYTLTLEQQRILAEQRKIERRKAVANESIKRNKKRLMQIGSMFSNEKQVSSELLSRIGNDGGFAGKFKELEILITPISPLISLTNCEDVGSLEKTAQRVAECVKSAEKITDEISKIASQNEVQLRANINNAIDKGFTTSFADIQKRSSDSIYKLKETAKSQLITIKNSTVLPTQLKVEIENAIIGLNDIEDEVFMKNFIAVSVSPLIKRCNQFIAEYESSHEEFELLYTEYVAICDLYYYVAQEYPCCNDSIEKLKLEIKRIKEAVAEDDEQAYISDCLDEVMEEMGYSVLGSREVTKKNGKHFRNELYTYGEGTAVNVTYSADGKIVMELGGLDSTDRLPDSNESTALCESMESFCKDFKEIEKRLLVKGVVLADRISLLPPSAEYAQIINIADYHMTEKAETFQAKKQRRTATKRKALRKE